MPNRSRRLHKKLHRRHLSDVSLYASQVLTWRARLFDLGSTDVISIDPDSCDGLPDDVCFAIRQYHLRYLAKRVTCVELSSVDQFTKADGAVIFRFWAVDFPEVKSYMGNARPASSP